MALSINTNTAILSAYQILAAQSARQDEALSTASAAAAPASPQVADTVQFAHANTEATALSRTIDDADMAAQITHSAEARIGANAAAALVAQANSTPETV